MRGQGKKGGSHEDEYSSGDDMVVAPPSSSKMAPDSHAWKTLTFFLCVVAIYASYISQGVLQEKLSTKKYGQDGQRFQYLAFLHLPQCAMCFLWSFSMLSIWQGQPRSKPPPLRAYCAPSVSNTIGPACGILALRYISFPAQVLAKSSKMIPVMLMGAIVYGVRYTLQEYLCTLLVAGGVSIFALGKNTSISSKVASPNAPLVMVCVYSTWAWMDSRMLVKTPSLQVLVDLVQGANYDSFGYGGDRYQHINAWHIMMGMNLWGTIYMSLFMFLVPGAGGFPAWSFCASHPDVSWDIFWFCLCGAIGQNFIFLTISRFGALANTTVTTTRKFVSILISSIWNKNSLSMQQWTGVCMVFGGLSYQIWLTYQKKRRQATEERVTVSTVGTQTPQRGRSPVSHHRGRSPSIHRARKRHHYLRR